MTKEQAAEWLRDHSEWLKQWGWGEYSEQVVKAADLLGTTNPAITEAIAATREEDARIAELLADSTVLEGFADKALARTVSKIVRDTGLVIASAIRKAQPPKED